MRTLVALLLVVAGATACGDDPAASAVAGCDGPATVADADGLRDALDAVAPGDVVVLADGRYDGHFVARASGTATDPITLCGSADAVLDGGPVDTGYTLHLDGASGWRLRGFAVTGGQKGVMLDGASGNELVGLRISGTGDEALHLRTGSSDNRVTGLRIRDTGRREPSYGEGIYVGSAASNWCDLTGCEPDRSDRNVLVDNDVAGTTAEAVDVKEGTSDGVLRGNALAGPVGDAADSVVDLKGNGWVVRGNRLEGPGDGVQVHVVVDGWGRGNRVVANSFTLTGDGDAVLLEGEANRAGNVVGCGQTVRLSGGEANDVPCG